MRSTWGMVADGGSCMRSCVLNTRTVCGTWRTWWAVNSNEMEIDLKATGKLIKPRRNFPAGAFCNYRFRRLLQMGVWRPNPAPFATAIPAPFANRGVRRLLQLAGCKPAPFATLKPCTVYEYRCDWLIVLLSSKERQLVGWSPNSGHLRPLTRTSSA